MRENFHLWAKIFLNATYALKSIKYKIYFSILKIQMDYSQNNRKYILKVIVLLSKSHSIALQWNFSSVLHFKKFILNALNHLELFPYKDVWLLYCYVFNYRMSYKSFHISKNGKKSKKFCIERQIAQYDFSKLFMTNESIILTLRRSKLWDSWVRAQWAWQAPVRESSFNSRIFNAVKVFSDLY